MITSLLAAALISLAPAEPPGKQSSVLVTVWLDEVRKRQAQGVVAHNGHVVVDMRALADVRAVDIAVPASQRSHRSTGVAAHNGEAMLALLAVAWEGEPPPDASIFDATPKSLPSKDAGSPPLPVSDWDEIHFWISMNGAQMPRNVTGFLWGDNGVAGYIQHIGPRSPSPKGPADGEPVDIAHCIRPEIIRALTPSNVIGWDAWPAPLERIHRCVITCRKAYDEVDPARAMVLAKEAVEQDPASAMAWIALAKAHMLHNDYSACRQAATQAMKLGPTYAQPHWFMARLQYRDGDLAGAIASSKQGVARRPDDSAMLFTLGWYLERNGQHADAIAAYERAISANATCFEASQGLERCRNALSEPVSDPATKRGPLDFGL